MPYIQTPTSLRAQRLGELLRQLRKQRGITLMTAAAHLGLDHSALARFERCQWPLLPGRVEALLDIYQITNPHQRAMLLHLDRHHHRVDAWDPDDLHHTSPPSLNPTRPETTMPFQERHHPTLRSQWLAEQLRELRTSRGLTLQQAAEHLPVDWSMISRFERGELKLKYDYVAALLDLYHVFDDRQRNTLLSLALDIRHANNWDADFTDELPHHPYVNLAWLEHRAAHIRYYATGRIPDLLQTPAYAAHLIQLQMGLRKPTPEHQAALDVLTARQRTFHRGDGHLTVVLTEHALRNQVGDDHTMAEQLAHLRKVATDRRYTIQILPLHTAAAARYDTPFTVFDMPAPYPPVAVTQSLAGRLYLERPRSLRFTIAYDHIHADARPETETPHLLTTIEQASRSAAASERPGDDQAAATTVSAPPARRRPIDA
ncbi:Scr1 family TA system antitoxin-like transcriptional regulator [Polymorphospora sp. NPDC050346]|uniref:Scr1 family TA system antitoxin-like transcriptional regulator n=1 Tax=Polymorphospora sp. NPDC050346 TaxID=3155780 RepID=UPI0033C708DC